ncbi:MAG: methylated-DNA--[protein]-cysteine S-methyltransferase [Alphaproteobacteria bacterium]|nr:methylated-DNA--[protein]-cysteine S-methyltransferase [Alphaproteobacteria bacterium]MCB9929837.1 methylated-DNA--[protein]-cysteine S-methyltransferase [Alphaproteobacteria bacterium]
MNAPLPPHPDDTQPQYALIEAAMAWLADMRTEQPSLEDLAEHIGYAPAHLQKVFTRWVGVSPKRFLSYLTLDYAKERLAEADSVLDAAYAAGLSAPSRLHDLFVAHEGITPGDYKRRGAGLAVQWGWHNSPFGDALVMQTERGVCGLAFASGEAGRQAVLANMQARWPAATFAENRAATGATAAAIFGEEGQRIPLHLTGTNFQVRVWEALLRIPDGALVPYQWVANAIGQPSAARAVGAAIGRNPVSFLIPCHRAILTSGYLRNYEWGLPRKMAMIGWEAAHRQKAA